MVNTLKHASSVEPYNSSDYHNVILVKIETILNSCKGYSRNKLIKYLK